MRLPLTRCLAYALLFSSSAWVARAAPDPLAAGFAAPPPEARVRAYWWWLNGNATRESITRDLEQMKAKGFGGALICDADGSSQDGNDRAPHGPDFFSPAWRELYKHTVREAARLGLELSLNIQSGWNLGGPTVTPDDAAKKLAWSETTVRGGNVDVSLPEPKKRDGYYKDLFVVAYRIKPNGAAGAAIASASSEQADHPAQAAMDGDANTFWVSTGNSAGEGPKPDKPAWIQVALKEPTAVDRVVVTPRNGYGPRDCELQASDDGQVFRSIKRFAMRINGAFTATIPSTTARVFRLVVTGAFDPRFPSAPRNIQIAEIQLMNGARSIAGAEAKGSRIQNWEAKAMHRTLHFSAPDTTPLLIDAPAQPGEEDARAVEVVDLTGKLDREGRLRWKAPEGTWQALRFGCTIGDHSRVSTSSEGWSGYALDVLDEGALRRYWDAVVEPLIRDAGEHAGKTMKYLHTDSWEVEAVNWTPTLREEFKKRRGYDLLPYLPVIAGRIVDSRKVSNRFLNDFRKTLGDLAVDNHYQPFLKWAHRHGMEIHPESGGPHASPIDAQRCLGQNDAPMSEFWAWSWRHRVGDSNRFFVKQPASAAHTYGKRLVLAEGFTTIGPHWQETLWDNLKPAFDHACSEGLNRLVWHAFVCSPVSEGMPGQQYFAGTHLNPNVTWWEKSAPFFAYLNRCQFMLQRGLFAADALYYYGDHVPNFAQIRASDPARVGKGYDYDVLTEEALLNRVTAKNGRLELPDGASYRLLVLPERSAISLAALRKVKELAAGGATIVGPRPGEASSLNDFPRCDDEVRALGEELWNDHAEESRGRPSPRVIAGKTAREVLLGAGIKPDFEFSGGSAEAEIDYIHRRDGDTEIYFISSRGKKPEALRCAFRTAGKAPELWDAVSGDRRFATDYAAADGRTSLPIELGPFGSIFVVFREPAAGHPASGKPNFARFEPVQKISGPWTTRFDPKWGGPAQTNFPQLVDWTARPEPGIRFYSGTAAYQTTFALREHSKDNALWLDLGEVREVAEVRVNGKRAGIVWAPPFRVNLSGLTQPGDNQLEVEVVNFWPNRIIGDDALPKEQRLTRTNIRKLTNGTPLMPSGLIGPVMVVESF